MLKSSFRGEVVDAHLDTTEVDGCLIREDDARLIVLLVFEHACSVRSDVR